MKKIIVDSGKIEPRNEFVCWVDTMGTKRKMSESFKGSIDFMIRFHRCLQISIKQTGKALYYYPVMDGIYFTCDNVDNLKSILCVFYTNVAEEFLSEENMKNKFVIRGAIAYGETFHGESILDDMCKDFSDDVKNNILVGTPMIQAYQSESLCPPFGIYIHESARKKDAFQSKYFYWYQNSKDNKFKTELRNSSMAYFNWCKKFHSYLEMEEKKIDGYLHLIDEFYGNMDEYQIVDGYLKEPENKFV